MIKTATTRHTCIACGHKHEEVAMRPFGRRPDGTIQTWACRECLDAKPAVAPRPDEQLTAAVLEVIA